MAVFIPTVPDYISGYYSPYSSPPDLPLFLGSPKSPSVVRRSNFAPVIPILTKLQNDCATHRDDLKKVAEAMEDNMRTGLAVDGGSNLPMIPSYVDSLPTGNEEGLFYALDLGGTNFRVLRVQLGGEDKANVPTESVEVKIEQELMYGTSKELFDFMASGLAKFIEQENGNFQLNDDERKREIGFTFSFPVKQTSIYSGKLIEWTKGFAVSDTVGKDVVVCLNEAIKAQGLDMRVSALVNDTVGTLAGARYRDNAVMVSIILGTGTNACYVERIDKIKKLKCHNSQSETMIINMEWGAFRDDLPLTEFDIDMDEVSNNPGQQIFEKKLSGMYLGEIVRRVLVKMAEEESLFGESPLKKLSTPFVLRTEHLSEMQKDKSEDLETVELLLEKIAGVKSDVDARETVKKVIDTIVKRGARLAGAGIVGILQKMEKDTPGVIFGERTVVAVDGGLYENYPQYGEYLQGAVTELLGKTISDNIEIKLFKDASGIGASLLAATNSEYKQCFYCMEFIELFSSCCVHGFK